MQTKRKAESVDNLVTDSVTFTVAYSLYTSSQVNDKSFVVESDRRFFSVITKTSIRIFSIATYLNLKNVRCFFRFFVRYIDPQPFIYLLKKNDF